MTHEQLRAEFRASMLRRSAPAPLNGPERRPRRTKALMAHILELGRQITTMPSYEPPPDVRFRAAWRP